VVEENSAEAIPAILGAMAKVMVSLPDELLERIDMRARARHSTRSGFLRDLAERELVADEQRTQTEIEALLGDPVRLGGDATALIRQDRRSR
jgi:ketopantoate reductase